MFPQDNYTPFGYIDKQGVMIVKPVFNWAGNFSDGIAGVNIGSKWGYIDKAGNYVWKPTN